MGETRWYIISIGKRGGIKYNSGPFDTFEDALAEWKLSAFYHNREKVIVETVYG
jgi:hypothetical protein